MSKPTELEQLTPGVIKITAEKQGWYSVAIGRTRTTKRFWLSDAEARQLIDRLTEILPAT